jgi:hypothetical protein
MIAVEVLGWAVIALIGLAAVACLAALYVYVLVGMGIPWLIRDAFRWLAGHRSTEG